MNKGITAVFHDVEKASHAVQELIGMGVDRDEISVLMSERTRDRYFGPKTTGQHVEAVKEEKSGDKSEEGAAAGAAVGGALGAIAGAMTAVGAIIAPGIGLLVAGPIVATLAGAGAGGTAGGVVGFLAGMGVKENTAKNYAKSLEEGAVLITVHSERDRKLVEKVLEKNGATDVSA